MHVNPFNTLQNVHTKFVYFLLESTRASKTDGRASNNNDNLPRVGQSFGEFSSVQAASGKSTQNYRICWENAGKINYPVLYHNNFIQRGWTNSTSCFKFKLNVN